jgi:hypothetical protein
MGYVQYIFCRTMNVVGFVLLFAMATVTPSVASPLVTMCKEANIACAKTVTAHVSASGRIWFAWTVNDYLYVNYSADRGKTLSNMKNTILYPSPTQN